MNRRGFGKVVLLTTSSLFLPGCVGSKETEIITEGESLENNRKENNKIALMNFWDYRVSFDIEKFKQIIDGYGLPYLDDNSVNIVFTNETRVYETPHENQGHIAIVSQNKTPDVIQISCGRYVEEINKDPSREPYTKEDQLFLSALLSDSIFNGFADLAAIRGNITNDECYHMGVNFLDAIKYSENPIDFIFTYVHLFQEKPYQNSA